MDGDAWTAMAPVQASRTGDIAVVKHLSAEHRGAGTGDDPGPAYADARCRGPARAYFRDGPAVVRISSDPAPTRYAVTKGQHSDTPLQWAASCDDADAAGSMISGGADIETPEGSIGAPQASAAGYRCWHAGAGCMARGQS
jgi:hypothetical protein